MPRVRKMLKNNDYRKREIKELAESIALEYFPQDLIEPNLIAKSNGITFSYGHYEDAFDGLLDYRDSHFHIFLNLDRNNDRDSPRMRYTFSHELGHYFIDEHRNAIKSGRVKQHASFNPPNTKNQAEAEADYFASCLLLPENKVRSFCYRRPLSSELLNDIARRFKVSATAVIYKYFELSLFPMLFVKSERGRVSWSRFTDGFKYWHSPAKGSNVPANTVVWEYYNQGRTYAKEEIVVADDWFSDQWRQKDEQFYEKCYYLSEEKVLSVIWKKER